MNDFHVDNIQIKNEMEYMSRMADVHHFESKRITDADVEAQMGGGSFDTPWGKSPKLGYANFKFKNGDTLKTPFRNLNYIAVGVGFGALGLSIESTDIYVYMHQLGTYSDPRITQNTKCNMHFAQIGRAYYLASRKMGYSEKELIELIDKGLSAMPFSVHE